MPHQKIATGKRSSAWTLVEMLAVLGILALLTAATVPALQGMSRSGRTAAIGQIMGLFDQARSLALAQGRPVYVVIADRTVGGEQACRAIGIYQEQEDTSLSPALTSRWHVLPVGCRFLDDAGTPSLLTAPQSDAEAPRFVLPGESASRALPYLKFNPTGGVDHPAQSLWTRLFLSARQGNADIPADQISIARFTGRPKCESAQ